MPAPDQLLFFICSTYLFNKFFHLLIILSLRSGIALSILLTPRRLVTLSKHTQADLLYIGITVRIFFAELFSHVAALPSRERKYLEMENTKLNILIRQECEADFDSVYEVVRSAFETMDMASGDEQDLVNRLRKSTAFIPELSLVAELDGKIIGHIMFTKMKIGVHPALTLAPVAVLPEYQKQGIGGKLIVEGHRIARELGHSVVILVGHADYYPRFGYTPAGIKNIQAPFEVPEDAFMVLELREDGLKGVSGMIEFAPEFFPDA